MRHYYKFKNQCSSCQAPYQLMGGACGCSDGFFSDCLKDFHSYYTPPKGGASPMGAAEINACFNDVTPSLSKLPSGQPATNLSCISCACWAGIGGKANARVAPLHKDHCRGNKGVAANYFCSPCPAGSVAVASPLGVITKCTPCPAGTVPNAAKSQCVAANLAPYEIAPGAGAAPGLTLNRILSYVSAGGVAATAGTYSDGKTSSAAGTTTGLKPTITQLPACKGVSSVEVQQTSAGIDSIKYYVNYGTQKVLLSASGNLASAVAATTFNAPAADSLLAGLSGNLSGTTMVSVKDAAWAAPGACTTPNRCIKQITAFVQSGRIVGIQTDYNTGAPDKIGRQRGTKVTQVLPDCTTDPTVAMSLCQTAAGGLTGFSIKTASGKSFNYGSSACSSPVSITATCPGTAKPAITSFGFSTRTDSTLNTLLPGPGCPSLPSDPVTTKPLCIKCRAGNRVVAVAGWWDAAAKLVNGLEVTCSNGATLLSGLRDGITSRVIIPDGDLLSEVRISQKTTTTAQYGAMTKLSLYSSTGKLLGLFGNTDTTDRESVIKATKSGQSLTGFCTKVVAGAGLAPRVADLTDATYADWTPPIQAAQKRITKVTGYYVPGDPDKTIVGYLYTYTDGTTELVGFSTSESETKNVPTGQILTKVESNQDDKGIERIVFTTDKGVPLDFGRPESEVTKPKTTVVAPPGEQVQVTPVYGTDGTNSLQGIGAEEILQMTVLKPSLDVGSPSELQAVYTYGGKPVAGKVVTFTVTDSKTGAVKTYTGTTDANGLAKVVVDASEVPAVGKVYASVPSSKPDANGPVAATLAPGSGSTITWIAPTPGDEKLVLSAGPTQVPVNGSITLTATYTVNGTATPGKTVTFEVTLPNGQKVYPTCTTGTRRAGAARQTSPGTCSVTVSSPVPGGLTATATVPGTSGPITSTSPGPDGKPTNGQSSTVTVVTPPPPPPGKELLVLSATPSQVPVNGSITLTASYSVNGTATPGKTVTFEVTLPNGQKVFPTCTTGTRRAGAARQTSPGTCSVTVSSPVPGDVVATASVPGTSGTITSTSPGPDGKPTNGQSSTIPVVVPSTEKLTITGGPTTVPVGGNTTLTATYAVDDKPVAGKVVTFEVTLPDGTKRNPSCTTGADGKCDVFVSSPVAGPMTTTGSTPGSNGTPVSATGPVITWTQQLASPSPKPDTEKLTIAATPNQVPVNGSVTVSATYTVNDKPTAGKVVTFEVIRPDGTKINPTCTTDATGTCSVTVSSTEPGTMSATATTPGNDGPVKSTSPGADGIATGGQSSTIQVVSPQKPNTLTYTVVDPMNIVGDTATATATLLDPSGKPVAGQPVTFTMRDPATGGVIQNLVGTTNAQITDPSTGTTTTRTAVTDSTGVATLPDLVVNGPGQLQVTASTPGGMGTVSSTPSTYTWTNGPPTANADTYPYTPTPGPCSTGFICNDPLVVAAVNGVLKNDVDPEGQPLTATLLTSTSNGVLTFSGNGFTYAPQPGYSGTDSFTYRVCDPFNACASTTVTLTPNPQPPNVALLVSLPAAYTGPNPILTADRPGIAGTDCTESPATEQTGTVTVSSPGLGQCTGPMPAGDLTLGVDSSSSDGWLLFDGWNCYKANTLNGVPTAKTAVSEGVFNFALGESATCVATYSLYTPPTVSLQIDAPTLDTYPVEAPTFACYEIKGGVATLVSRDGSVPNSGRGGVISCIVEYANLGASCSPGYYQPSRTSTCIPCDLDHYCPGTVTLNNPTMSSVVDECVALKCNPCPDEYPSPNTAMEEHCTSLTDSSGSSLSCADIAMIYTGDILLNCGSSMYFLPAANWAAGGPCVATKLLTYPNNEFFNGLSQGYVSNLVYASSGATGTVITFKIIADDNSPTGISLENVGQGVVAGCSGGSDITTGPDSNVYLWCTGNGYRGFRIPVFKDDPKMGFLDLSGAVKVNEGLGDGGTNNNNAGTFCTATYAVGLSLGDPDTTSNFWEFGVGFSAGANVAPRLTFFDATKSVGTTGGAVKPDCPRSATPDYSFLPPIAVADTYNADTTTNPQYFTVLSNDIDPYENALATIKLIDGSGAEVPELTISGGKLTVDTSTSPDQVQFIPNGITPSGGKVTFKYKAVDASGIVSKAAATVTLNFP
uniref:Big-1 domain-containing protein n=1 Tax=Tetradesmus obliquus TaxID=3088 RepID=A0A383VEM4_TETOB